MKPLPLGIEKLLKMQGYKIVGQHGAVKLCHWMKEALRRSGVCYKSQFYGIATHRCLQMSPAALVCTQQCLFCWRYQKYNAHVKKWCEPEAMLEESINAQRALLSGYKGDTRTDLRLWQEANKPMHVAISLIGEPMLYPYMSDFIELCHRHGMTTFLVTNGTLPEQIEALDTLPTQLYVTVAAPEEAIYEKLQRPLIENGWKRLMKTLQILPSLTTRVVIRHTLVRGYNMAEKHIAKYARLAEIAEPAFIEPKAYMFVGYSRQRLSLKNMPSHAEVKEFGQRLAAELGYEVLDENARSRVLLLGSGKRARRIEGLRNCCKFGPT